MDPLAGIDGQALRLVLLYVRQSGEPVTADDVAAALGVHRGVARSRLERLLQAGLIEADFVRRLGRSGPGAGRPSKIYSAAPESQIREFPPRHFAALIARLLDEVPDRRRTRALRQVGEDFGRHLADVAALRPSRRVEEGLERVCAAVRLLGFNATLDRLEGKTAFITTPICPLRPLVVERVDAVHIDRGMWAGLVERGVARLRAEWVRCETDSCLDGSAPCSVTIRLGRRLPTGSLHELQRSID